MYQGLQDKTTKIFFSLFSYPLKLKLGEVIKNVNSEIAKYSINLVWKKLKEMV